MRQWLLMVCLLGVAQASLAVTDVQVKGLFGGSAVLIIDGTQHLLKAGKTSPEGVRLISADSKKAIVEIDGKRHTLSLSKRIGASYQKTDAAEVRLASGFGGHYVTPGRINNRPVEVMVDTGATSVAMNLSTAEKLGLNYRAGKESSVSTANGVVQAFNVMLESVAIGSVTVRNVEATVLIGDSPEIILLGNSYLNHVNLSRENGVLVLQSKY